MQQSFTHLNVSSAYSLRYGTALPEKIVAKASFHNFSKLALTDQDTMSGAINFVHNCMIQGITPIVGVDFNLGKSRALVLARGKNGWRDLCRLVSSAHQKERGKPVLDVSLLWEKMQQGNLVAILGINSEIGQSVLRNRIDLANSFLQNWLSHVDRNDVVIEVTAHPNSHKVTDPKYSLSTASKMAAFAKDNRLRAVLTNAVRYLDPEDAIVAELLDSVETKKQMRFEQVTGFRGSAYLKSSADMAQVAYNIGKHLSSPETAMLLLKFTQQIAEECSLDPIKDIGIGSISVPENDVVLGKNSLEPMKVLVDKCQSGLTKLGFGHKLKYQVFDLIPHQCQYQVVHFLKEIKTFPLAVHI